MPKLPCSLENPCQACLQSAAEGEGADRKTLAFRRCVRARFADVNIFESPESGAADAMQTETLTRMLGGLLARIAAPADFTLVSSPAAFNQAMISWLTDPDFRLPSGSLVGLCCSSILGLQIREAADADAHADVDAADADANELVLDFRRFLLATSLAHAGWRDGSLKAIRSNDLRAAGHISGARLFRRLDRVLTPQFLARCGRDQCQVLFLLVLGAVLGVAYYSSALLEEVGDSAPGFRPAAVDMLSPELQRSPTLWLAMKEQLCQMLAYHLIYLGSILGIKFEAGVEQRIIETAAARWNKAEEFVWADMLSSRSGVGKDQSEERTEEERPPSRRMSESPEIVSTEDVDEDSVLVRLSSTRVSGSDCVPASSSEPRPPPPPPPPPSSSSPPQPPPLATISLSELKQFHPEFANAWSENPKSYLSMSDDELGTTDERAASSTPGGAAPEQHARRRQSEDHEEVQLGVRKRRSMWIVRSFDAGPERGLVNVHARLRPGAGLESIRAFV
ncbi:hypothetical protein VTH06DRAFT_5230 [Thermothelomyces fergusii]